MFAPTDDEVEHAQRIIAAFEEAEAEGRGVVTVDGRMIENLHVEQRPPHAGADRRHRRAGRRITRRARDPPVAGSNVARVLAAGPEIDVGRDDDRRVGAATLTPLAVYAGVLAVLLLVSWQTVARFSEFPAGIPPLHFAGQWFWDGWVRLDSGWYDSIVEHGYAYVPGQQSNIAFFPGYPLVVRAVSHLTGNTPLAGVLTTIVCGALAFVAFGRWCRDRLDPAETLTALLCLAFYPYAYYLFGVMYGDALFLLLALAAFLAFERDYLLLAGVAGAAATATRFVGLAVVVGLAVGVLERRAVVCDAERGRWFSVDRSRLRELRPGDARVLVALAGIGAWCAYLWQRFGDPLAFSTVQAAWGQQAGLVTWAKRDFFAALVRRPADLYTVGLVLQLAAAVLVALSVPIVGRRFGWRYAAYMAVVVALPVIGSQDFQGTGRYMLGAFPAFAAAGALLVGAGPAAPGRAPRVGHGPRAVHRPVRERALPVMTTATSPDIHLSFVFPMWNEEAMIRRTLAAASETGERLVRSGEVGSYEVVVVDDASTDGTGKIADELADDDPRIVVVHHSRNRKLGGALRSGFAAATGALVLYTDADLPCDLDEAAKALRLLRLYDADIVSAYRFDRTAEGAQRTLYSLRLQPPRALGARRAGARRQLRVQARAAAGARPRRAAQRGQLRRRRAGGQGPPAGVPARAVRGRLHRPHPGHVDPLVARGDRHDDARAAGALRRDPRRRPAAGGAARR